MIKAFYSGKKIVYVSQHNTGRTIKASGNHPFLKLEGWTALDKLKNGDRSRAYQGHLNAQHPPSSQKPIDELVLLAHLLGDGCILPKQPYHYTSAR